MASRSFYNEEIWGFDLGLIIQETIKYFSFNLLSAKWFRKLDWRCHENILTLVIKRYDIRAKWMKNVVNLSKCFKDLYPNFSLISFILYSTCDWWINYRIHIVCEDRELYVEGFLRNKKTVELWGSILSYKNQS